VAADGAKSARAVVGDVVAAVSNRCFAIATAAGRQDCVLDDGCGGMVLNARKVAREGAVCNGQSAIIGNASVVFGESAVDDGRWTAVGGNGCAASFVAGEGAVDDAQCTRVVNGPRLATPVIGEGAIGDAQCTCVVNGPAEAVAVP
jgi:hypothetical protein